MKLEDVLLTKDQRKSLCTGCYPCDLVLGEQCLKLLDVLNKMGVSDYTKSTDTFTFVLPLGEFQKLEKILKEG